MCPNELDHKLSVQYNREALTILLRKITQSHYIRFQKTDTYAKIKLLDSNRNKSVKAFTYKEQKLLALEVNPIFNVFIRNLQFLALRKYTPEIRIAIAETAIYNTEGLGLVIIDGIRDMVYDINSPANRQKSFPNLCSGRMNGKSTSIPSCTRTKRMKMHVDISERS